MKELLICLLLAGSVSANAMDVIAIAGDVSKVECSIKNGKYRGIVQFATVTIPRTDYEIDAIKRSLDIYDLCQILSKASLGRQDLTITQLFIRCEGYNCRTAKVIGAVMSQPDLSPIAMFKLP